MKVWRIVTLVLLTLSGAVVLAQDAPMKSEKTVKVRNERAYIIHDRSSKVSRVDIRKDVKGDNNIIQIDATNASGGVGLVSKVSLSPAIINNITVASGSYNQIRELSKTSRGMSIQLLDVGFPCRIRFHIADQHADIEFKEAGFWKVSLGLIN